MGWSGDVCLCVCVPVFGHVWLCMRACIGACATAGRHPPQVCAPAFIVRTLLIDWKSVTHLVGEGAGPLVKTKTIFGETMGGGEAGGGRFIDFLLVSYELLRKGPAAPPPFPPP